MAAVKPKPKPKGLGARLTAKAGPLPVWAWAALILGAVYAYTKLHPSSSSSSHSAAAPAPVDTSGGQGNTDTGNPTGGASGGGGMGDPSSQFNDALFGLLSGLQGSVDNLTAKVQSTPASQPTSTATNDGGPSGPVLPVGYNPANYENLPPYSSQSGPANTTPAGYDLGGLNLVAGGGGGGAPAPAPAPRVPAPSAAPAPSRYYTYAPGRAPAGRQADEAPTTAGLHFEGGRGYYY